ncbi:MAG TPA: EAL domain-containing protein [Plasticicumulans sp.]|nr:EAL domain-containing protein [Plasticicumulans sp.]
MFDFLRTLFTGDETPSFDDVAGLDTAIARIIAGTDPRLKLLPVQKIKIDKSFVDGLPHSVNDQSIVRSIVALGRALQLYLVAEGVETAEQSAWLEHEGVDYLQGFLYARPMEYEQLREFLKKRVSG